MTARPQPPDDPPISEEEIEEYAKLCPYDWTFCRCRNGWHWNGTEWIVCPDCDGYGGWGHSW